MDPPAKRGPAVPPSLAGLRCTEVSRRSYTVHATVYVLGVPVFSRRDVGGGYASAEVAFSDGAQVVGLQFAAGAWPERAAGLNRFGVVKEICVDSFADKPATSVVGLMSTSREASLEEARATLHSSSPSIEITMIRGGSVAGRAWAQTENLRTPVPRNWVSAHELLTELLKRDCPSRIRELEAPGLAPFLCTIWRHGLGQRTAFRSGFFHGASQFVLEARWAESSPQELCGLIRSTKGAKLAEFRTCYAHGDSSGLPIRIEYRPTSFLKLTFEAQPVPSSRIPSIFPEEN